MGIWHKAKLLKKVLTDVSDAKALYKFDKGWINEKNAKDFIAPPEHCQSLLVLLPQVWR